jgi:hypothetical protein
VVQGPQQAGALRSLAPDARLLAHRLLGKFCARWRGDLSRWRFGMLVGQAKRLAQNPPDSALGPVNGRQEGWLYGAAIAWSGLNQAHLYFEYLVGRAHHEKD